MDDFSVAFLMNPKDFLEACGLWQTTAAAGLKETRQGLTRAWELEQSNVSAFLMLLLTSVCGQIIWVSTRGGLRVLGRLDVRAQKLVWLSWRRCVGAVGHSGVAEGEPARAAGREESLCQLSCL